MGNQIVKYSNALNSQGLRNFNAINLDILMAICSRLRDKKEEEVTFKFSELKKLMCCEKNISNAELAQRIIETNKKLLALNFAYEDKDEYVQFNLFSCFKTNLKEAKLTVAVNKQFTFLLNNLTSNFTRFELSSYMKLKSSYSKEAFRRLKMFRNTGIWRVNVNDFRRLLDIPDSYKTNINSKVIRVILNELEPIIGLKVKSIYSSEIKRGRRKIVAYEFTFNKEKVKLVEEENERISKAIKDKETAKKHREEFETFRKEHNGLSPWKFFRRFGI
ncbi:replication initiation protein [Gardnerella sp. DNF01199S]|uniref:replication initiation protein n=1 Tax=Gardnerella sp. DNF01199S TaxID=2749067 RepID=UPI003BA9DCC9